MTIHEVAPSMLYPTPPQPRRRPTAFIVTTVALGIGLVIALVFAGIQTVSVSSAQEAKATAITDGNKAAAAADDEIDGLKDELSAANAQAATCEKAANLLAKGQSGYVKLYNSVLRMANRWRYVFDTTLYVALRTDEVSDAQIEAAWDALNNCTDQDTGIDAL